MVSELLNQNYGFELPTLPDEDNNSTYYYKQLLEEKIRKDILKTMNQKNMGLYFLGTYTDYIHGAYHGVFKSGIYEVFLMNPKKFFEIISIKSNNAMIPGVCGMMGAAYYDPSNEWINGMEGVKQGYEFEVIHKNELSYLDPKFTKSCIEIINDASQR